ncbi:hypothetical protein FACS189473_5740 [Spirochaetia bacterium]|nr:hypothetical protein FACS189473_5740 [Spirochaetia bacterium]
MKKDKRWNLMANLFDKSLIRNELGLKLGDIFDNMAWTAHSEQVSLYLNKEYNGVYLLTESVKITKDRINILPELSADDLNGGYIVEVYGGKTNSGDDPALIFQTPQVKTRGAFTNGFQISEPDSDVTTAMINKVKTDVTAAENALYASAFPNNNYQDLIDVDSFIDWYLVMELAKNPDANFFASCYMYYDPADKKLHMGPLWDFDIGFGNDSMNASATNKFSDPEGFHINASSTYPYGTATPTPWITRLFQDPAFKAKVRARWDAKKAQLDTLSSVIDDMAAHLASAQGLNFAKWNTTLSHAFWNQASSGSIWGNWGGGGTANPLVPGTYAGEITNLKNFITQRIAWMHTNLQ